MDDRTTVLAGILCLVAMTKCSSGDLPCNVLPPDGLPPLLTVTNATTGQPICDAVLVIVSESDSAGTGDASETVAEGTG